MAITYPLAQPSQLVATQMSVPVIARKVSVARSPFTAEQTTYEWASAYWVSSITTAAMQRETGGAALEAFFNSLHGPVGTFLWTPPHATTPRGTTNTTGITVSGAGQSGTSLTVAGMGANKTLLSGSYLQLGTSSTTRLHQVVEDATANASGVATLTIEPFLRYSPANGAAVVLLSPQGQWRLSSQPSITITGQGGNGALYASYTFSIEEAL